MKTKTIYIANDGKEFDNALEARHHENRMNLITKIRAHMNWEENQIIGLLSEIYDSTDLAEAFMDYLDSTKDRIVISGAGAIVPRR